MRYERINRRKHKRIEARLEAEFAIIAEGIDGYVYSRKIQTKTKNISINGVWLGTNVVQIDELHICSSLSGIDKNRLKLEIQLPSGFKTINPIGEVCWYDLNHENDEYLYNVGVSFVELSKGDREVLKRFITTAKKKTKTWISSLRKWFLRD